MGTAATRPGKHEDEKSDGNDEIVHAGTIDFDRSAAQRKETSEAEKSGDDSMLRHCLSYLINFAQVRQRLGRTIGQTVCN